MSRSGRMLRYGNVKHHSQFGIWALKVWEQVGKAKPQESCEPCLEFGFIVRCVEAVDGCETEKRHDQVCLLGKPSTTLCLLEPLQRKGGYNRHSLEPWMQACGYVLWKKGRGASRRIQASRFCSSPCTTTQAQTFHTKKLCRQTPDLSSLNRSFVMLLPCYKTFSVFYSENVNF